ncbi:MAG: penicillin-binding protein activator LpoB [Burkholderiales bacterium]|nr:penicillin-binding protein activator LpoB [Burkholderiales bacterium]
MIRSVALVRVAAVSVLAALVLGGCAKDTVRYGDARGVETVTNQFGSTDLQMIAEAMTRSLLDAPVVTAHNLPIVTVQEVRNKTSEYIDTRAITDSIRAELQKSGKVRFAVDAAGMSNQREEIDRQQDDEYYDREQVAEKGRMVGAQYRLEGNITSIVKQAKDIKDVYYKFNLQMWNIRNGLLEWTDEKEIRKTTTKG